jgi:hypothetical protein
VREGRQTPFAWCAGSKEDRVIGGRLVPSIETLGDAVFLERRIWERLLWQRPIAALARLTT